MTIINAFHPDYVRTYHPELMKTIRTEEKAKANGQLFGSKTRERESSTEPNYNSINKFPDREKVK